MATFEKENIFNMENSIEYTAGGVISKQVTKNQGGNLTLFSFDKEQGLSEHKTPFDAIVLILDGEAEITIGGNLHNLKKGDCIIMPANIPHALKAVERFKMLLTMIKQE
ncbi:MAG: cupin domain-containing protein [Ignavibacteriae bacterium]|jgi:quercetin dioxygenase-like cupin family protein|nr:cupin domain-containing protein [Bacteroidota bacterium]MCB0603869.1 cupin domain-containing protein [Saprospiraceae bacterium]MCB0751876.1 cupin domain-containing protein [Ignavibacteriota bacterium]MCO5277690.1 cupin domain-containing protein [Saprospiraceae bacterium]